MKKKDGDLGLVDPKIAKNNLMCNGLLKQWN